MRASAASFDLPALERACALAHGMGKRVYLTCNTLPRNDEFDGLPAFLRGAADAGVDAFIVTDLGVLSLLRETVPGAEIHISTQAGVVNLPGRPGILPDGGQTGGARPGAVPRRNRRNPGQDPARAGKSRSLSTGRCASPSRGGASSAIIWRPGTPTRGQCAQPCRWKYALMEEKTAEAVLPGLRG